MTKDEALALAFEALETSMYPQQKQLQAITAIKEALAQPEQEVDWEKLYRLEVKKKEALAAKYERDIKPLTKIVPMAQPEQEPIGFAVMERPWVGLTDEDKDEIIRVTESDHYNDILMLAEAKLKEKNT